MFSWLRKTLSKIREKRARHTPFLTDDGICFRWSDDRPDEGFRWNEVVEIRTYKADLFIYDSICLAFRANDLSFEICEEDSIFRELMEKLKAEFPEISEDWYFDVMQQPFATNMTVLWHVNKPVDLGNVATL